MKRVAILIPALMVLLFTHSAFAFYNPSAGRWLSRDPIEERGGKNIYALAGNGPVSNIDHLGLQGILPPHDPSYFVDLFNKPGCCEADIKRQKNY